MQKKLQDLLTLFNEAVYELNSDGMFTNAWTNNEENLFLPKSDFLNKELTEFLPPKVAQAFQSACRATIEKQHTHTVHCHLPPETDKWFKCKFKPFGNNMAMIIEDETDFHLAKKQIQHSEQVKELHNFMHRISETYYKQQLTFADVVRYFSAYFAKEFQISRVSCWVSKQDEKGKYIECFNLFELHNQSHSEGLKLYQADYPKYFKYLDSNCVLNAKDARTNKHTAEFTEGYLKPLNIFSMLDAPIHLEGLAHGVICCESVSEKRSWLPHEEQALIAMCNQVSCFLNFEYAHKKEAYQDAIKKAG